MIIKKREYTGSLRMGRPAKYPFSELEAGDCLEVEPNEDMKLDIARVKSALKQYIRNNSTTDWKVKVIEEEGLICVYRIE